MKTNYSTIKTISNKPTSNGVKNVLVIDNIDSFVYNLVQYAGILGGNPIVVQNTAKVEEIEKAVKENSISHIIISPGPKTPKEAGISNQIIKKFGPKIPILGICLGHQCIGYVFGAKIRKAKILRHGKTSLIKHCGKGILKGIKNPLAAARYHSLVVARKNLPDCLEITAESLDDGEIMGLKHRDYEIYGLQFHPESILTKEGIKIVKNFLEIK
ncbi:aminodeoxychorismate/anthranilate synthase component II [Patescibacteria group bacterium]|nr:aminodeoxychorismate/anthranilate synthase component II [bacterium]MBU4298880.1 aminodeoxychorismate/anthranilate synthase component II [Patescibacteria group bacterium]MBU4481570.1 aminodeoxychorismate/anthranilate synthase component II [Patescibacteria group bacterium]